MPTEHSPSLQDFKQGMSVQPPDTKQLAQIRARKRVWTAIGVFAVVLVVLGLINLRTSPLVTSMKNKGVVVGAVVDENNAPLRASILVIGTSLEIQTDANGRFELREVPVGYQMVVVAYLGAGRAFSVHVQADVVSDMGTIQFVATRVP